MNFSFSEDALALRDGTRAFLEGRNPVERLRVLVDGGDGLALWSELAEMGLLGAAAPEARGGMGLSMVELVLLCEQAGRVCLPEPYSETAAVLVPLLADIGSGAGERLDEVIAGSRRIVLSHGANPFVNFAEGADGVVVVESAAVHWLDAAQASVEPRPTIDPLRRLSKLRPGMGSELASGPRANELATDAFARGAVAVAAELCGLTERMIELAVDYARTREQFGRAIGSFQAVKHLLADARVALDFARPVVYRAAAVVGQRDPRRDVVVAHAKLAASDAAIEAAERAIQVFGGMGYTFEADLHFFMKRAWALTGLWGDREAHLATLDDAVLGGRFPPGPGSTFE
ncbi:MAG: acyl-CoA dehydrogenase family protein [Pseudomonadota bacterium]